MVPIEGADVLENDLRKQGALLDILLKDRTTGRNIIWATDSYVTTGKRNDPFLPSKQIKPELVTGKYGLLIQPRAVKSKEEQKRRTKDKAEVFTPLHIVDKMNKDIDWAGKHQVVDKSNWQDYACELKLEITCGEAPFIVSRYDPTKRGDTWAIGRRVGFLDRKLRYISEYCDDTTDWLHWAEQAYKASYGYEWQGDNLLIARENLLYTLRDYYDDFCETRLKPLGIKYKRLTTKQLEHFAMIISWNIWQMDGLKYIIPLSKHVGERPIKKVKESRTLQQSSFGFETDIQEAKQIELFICQECERKGEAYHDGRPAKIMDWQTGKRLKFSELLQ